MKKTTISFLLAILSIASFSQAVKVEGDWLGTLDVGVKLRLVLHVKSDSTGSYSATLDSPDQGAKGIPVSSINITGDSLHVELKVINGKYEGAFTNDTTVTGSWSQGLALAALTLKKTKEVITINRPQTPKPPFSYSSNEVEYSNADNSVHFGGTFTYPSSGGPFPTAILITGSGQQDRDQTIFGHKPFAVIADYLTQRGFAVLRVDDRGTGKTTGEVMKATSFDFAKDVEAALAFLKKQPQTDTGRLGLIGHSEGALIAALVASRRKDINFMVLMAAPGVKGDDLLVDQAGAVFKAEGISPTTTNLYKPFYSQMMTISVTEKDTAVAFKKAWTAYTKWKLLAPGLNRNELGFTDDVTAAKMIQGLVHSFSVPWMKYFIQTDAAKLLEKTSAKVLAMNGEKDVQVLAKPNLAGIIVALQKSKSKVYDIKMLQNLNHLFQRCVKCSVSEYGQLEETINPEALIVLGNWLQKNVSSK